MNGSHNNSTIACAFPLQKVQVIFSLWRKIWLNSREETCPYARVIASWCDKDGVVRPGMLRPGIIRYFIVHSLETEGSQKSHAFAVVNWLKSSEDNFGFGSPLSDWRANDFKHAGPAVFCLFKEFIVSFYLLTKSTLDKNI